MTLKNLSMELQILVVEMTFQKKTELSEHFVRLYKTVSPDYLNV